MKSSASQKNQNSTDFRVFRPILEDFRGFLRDFSSNFRVFSGRFRISKREGEVAHRLRREKTGGKPSDGSTQNSFPKLPFATRKHSVFSEVPFRFCQNAVRIHRDGDLQPPPPFPKIAQRKQKKSICDMKNFSRIFAKSSPISH